MSMNPFHQFEIKNIIPIEIAGIDFSVTNSAFFMFAAVSIVIALYVIALKGASIIPSRIQSVAEIFFEFIFRLVKDFVGEEGKKYFPLVFSAFLFVLLGNLLGMMPYGFTVTSHIIITFGLGVALFLIVNIVAFARHGFHFFSFFLPAGIPMLMAPVMIIIELFTYISRPFSLSIRLAANMVAGHVLIKVLAGFVVMLGINYGWIPIPFISILIGFEIFVAVLQAYIFTILICVYLNDAVHMH